MHPPVSEYLRALGIVRDRHRAAAAAEPHRRSAGDRRAAAATDTTHAFCRFPRRAGSMPRSRAAPARGGSICTTTVAAQPDRAHGAQRSGADSRRPSARRESAARASGGAAAGAGRSRVLASRVLARRTRPRGRWASIRARWLRKVTKSSVGRTSVSSHWPARSPTNGRSVRFFLGPHEDQRGSRGPSKIFGRARESASSASLSRKLRGVWRSARSSSATMPASATSLRDSA